MKRDEPVAIVLAGGRGTRLVPLAPEFEKPIYPINGRPLVTWALEFARQFGARSNVVVTNPRTHDRVVKLATGYLPTVAVTQEEPTGVVDALRLALDAIPRNSEPRRVLVLCADNTFHPDGAWLREVVDSARAGLFVAVRDVLSTTVAAALTRVQPVSGTLERSSAASSTLCWLGPLVADLQELRRYQPKRRRSQTTIENWLNKFRRRKFIMMNCEDHGDAHRIR